jgi:hypothetical protein
MKKSYLVGINFAGKNEITDRKRKKTIKFAGKK